MADFRRWIFALAVVALLAGLSVPASAQPVVCNTSVSVTPIVRAEGLTELVGDLVLYCTGGTPTAPGVSVPQVNITVFLNTNITSKVLGTQLASFGNGQTSALDEALLIIDEPNSPNSPGVQCGPRGQWNGNSGQNVTNVCLGTNGFPNWGVSGIPYPILNCGAVVGGANAAPDGGPSGPGVCEIIAPFGPNNGPAPEHTYDGTIAGGSYQNATNGALFKDFCGATNPSQSGSGQYSGAFTTGGTGSVTISGITNLSNTGTGTAGISIGSLVAFANTPTVLTTGGSSNNYTFVAGTPINSPGTVTVGSGAKVTAITNSTVTISAAFGQSTSSTPAGAIGSYVGVFTFTGNTTLASTTQTALVTSGTNIITNLSVGTAGMTVGEVVSGLYLSSTGTTTIASIVNNNTITVASTASVPGNGSVLETLTFFTAVSTQQGVSGGPGYSCGRPNVFQGRMGALQNPNQYNAVTFWGVPLDPPGTAIGRTLRITNIRANANQLGVSSTFTVQQILMNIAINGPTTITIANPQQIVAYVNKGLNPAVSIAPGIITNAAGGTVTPTGSQAGGAITIGGGTARTGLAPNVPVMNEFVQCISQNPDLFNATPAPSFQTPGYLGANPLTNSNANLPESFNCPTGGVNCAVGHDTTDVTPWIRFSEGFASSWKEKNISFTVGDGTGATTGNGNANYNTTTLGFACANAYCYNGNRNHPLDVPQNVPGAVYNTETGFYYPAASSTVGAPPNPNPPLGFQFNADIIGGSVPNQGNAFTDDWTGTANATGISGAGAASEGTRLYLSFNNIPAGSSLWLPPVIYLFRQGVQHNNDPATLNSNPLTGQAQAQASGVMVMVNTDSAGANVAGVGYQVTQSINPFSLTKVGTSGLIVYEILYTDPYSTEYADVPVVLAYASNPGQNLPAPAPPNPNTSVTGGFAPFYTSAASTQPSPNSTFQSPTLSVPRFVPGQAFDFINIAKCACNLLFPFVANTAGYDTGIAIANASLDPGGTYGFSGTPQPGTVTFWYYGDMANGAAVPGSQTTSTPVQPGHVLTYVLSTGSSQYGLDGRGAGLLGYIITQAQFQYCHAFAYISAAGAGPTTPGTSEGYLGIVLDRDGLPRTISIGENKAH